MLRCFTAGDRGGRALSHRAGGRQCQKNFGASPDSLAVLESYPLRSPPSHGAALPRRGRYSTIRQAKDGGAAPARSRYCPRSVQAAVVQARGQLELPKAQIIATQAQVTSAEVALNGVREEARVGQRTTLDVLNAQQTLVNARVALVTAQRDRVVASIPCSPP